MLRGARRALSSLPATPPAIASRVQQIFEDHGGGSNFADFDTKFKVLAECERGLGFGIPHSHLGHLNSMEDVVNYFHWRADEAERERAAAATHWTLNLPDNVKLHANVPKKEPPALARGGKDAAASQNPADDE